ncbi:MAG: hypothetical protein MZU97_02160 [Bacillus subtilis]|nr:hypothetical protein [Bacillus subtilis]
MDIEWAKDGDCKRVIYYPSKTLKQFMRLKKGIISFSAYSLKERGKILAHGEEALEIKFASGKAKFYAGAEESDKLQKGEGFNRGYAANPDWDQF